MIFKSNIHLILTAVIKSLSVVNIYNENQGLGVMIKFKTTQKI